MNYRHIFGLIQDLIHKILYAGIGFAALTEQKAKEIVDDLEKRGEVSSEEGKKLVREMVDKARQQAGELRKMVTEEMDKICQKAKWVSRQDYEDLKKRIEKLEKQEKSAPPEDSL